MATATGSEPNSAASRWPDARWIRRLLVSVFVAFALFKFAEWFFYSTKTFLLTLVLAWFAAIAMEPAVDFLERRNVKRGLATGLIMVGGFVGFAIFIGVFGQMLFTQLSELIQSLPTYVEDTIAWVNRTFDTELDPERIFESLNIDRDQINKWAADIAGGVFGVVSAIIGFLFSAFTLLLFAFYFSAEGPRFRRWIASLFPPVHQPVIHTVWETAINKTGGYVVSRMILALISAVFTSIFLLALGVPYWLPLGIWVGVISQFIPTIGTYLAGALPVVISLTQSPWDAVWVLVFIVVYQQVENYWISPKISNRVMSIHPAVAFGAVIVGGALFGAWGALVAIPAVASLTALFETYGHRFELVNLENGSDSEASAAQPPAATDASDIERPTD
jgi:predicted PurR-regulated permease PerM